MGQRAHRRLRIGEGGDDTRRSGNVQHRGWILQTEQARNDRDVLRVRRGSCHRGLDLVRAGDVRGDVDHEQRVDLTGCEQEPRRSLEHERPGRGDEVDGVLRAAGRRELVQGRLQVRRKLGDLETSRDAGVGSDDRGSTAVAHHRDSPAGRDRLVGEKRANVEELLERVDADHPGLAEEGVDDGVGIGQGRSVRTRAARAGWGPPTLEHDDRLPAGQSSGNVRELPGVAERLEVQEDDVGRRVAGPVLHQVVGRNVGLVPQRHEGRDAEAQRVRPREQLDADASGLGREADAAGYRRDRRERGVHANCGVRVHDPDAVRPDETHASLPAHPSELLLDVGAARQFGEPPRDHDQPTRVLVRALPGDVEHRGGGYGDHDEVDRTGDFEHGGRRRVAGDGRRVWIHRVQDAGEVAPDQVVDDGATDRTRVAAGSDDGDGTGAEQSGDRVGLGDVVALGVRVEPALRGNQLEVGAADTGVPVFPADLETCVSEDVGHPVVLAEERGVEAADPAGGGTLRERLEQRSPEPTTLVFVFHHERDLGLVAVADRVVLRQRDDVAVDLGDEHAVAHVVGRWAQLTHRRVDWEGREEPQVP